MKTNPFMARHAETDKHGSGPAASDCLALHPLATRFPERSPFSIGSLVLLGLFILTGQAAAQPVAPAHLCIGVTDEHSGKVFFAGSEGFVSNQYVPGLSCPEVLTQSKSLYLYTVVLTPERACSYTRDEVTGTSGTESVDISGGTLKWCTEYKDNDLQWRSGYRKCEITPTFLLNTRCNDFGEYGIENFALDREIPPGKIVLSRMVNGESTTNVSSIDITEGEAATFMVHLDSNPTVDVTLSITTDIPGSNVTISPTTLSFTSGGLADSGGNYGTAQEVTITPTVDRIVDSETSGTITLLSTGGSNYEGTQRRVSLNIGDDDEAGLEIMLDGAPIGDRTLMYDRGQDITFKVNLTSEPSRPFSLSLSHTLSKSILFLPSMIAFNRSNWESPQDFLLRMPEEADKEAEVGSLLFKAIEAPPDYRNFDRTVPIIINTGDGTGGDDEAPDPNDPKTWTVQTQALAIPPVTAQDQAIVRLRCMQDNQCPVYLDCHAQTDGTKFEGRMGAPIPAWGATTLNARDIVDITGGSWENKGRLSCSIRSHSNVAALVWTRSGDGVLVNNSAAIASREIRNVGGGSHYQAEMASIPSPLSADGSNIRIRCAATGGRSCSDTSISCFDDEGMEHDGKLGIIESNTVNHLQTQELAEIISYQWQPGSLMSCEMRSDQPFTLQLLTRTGGGGALVNNSASGG